MPGESAAVFRCHSRAGPAIWDRLCCIWRLFRDHVGLSENPLRERVIATTGPMGTSDNVPAPWMTFGGNEVATRFLFSSGRLDSRYPRVSLRWAATSVDGHVRRNADCSRNTACKIDAEIIQRRPACKRCSHAVFPRRSARDLWPDDRPDNQAPR